jgi:long-chain acyl-CoA synthetase
MGSVGRPLPGVEVRIIEPDERGVGEIAVRGPNITLGYYRNLSATQGAIREGWLHTGDMGYLDRDGYLHLTGRIKDVIVTAAGKNVYPEEVERRYAELPSVRELCVVGLWNEKVLGETVHAGVVPQRGADREGQAFEQALRQAIQQRSRGVPSYQRLQHIHILADDLPKTLNGLIDRHRVKALLLARLAGTRDDGLALPTEWDGDSPGEPVAVAVAAPPRPSVATVPVRAEIKPVAEPVVPLVELPAEPIPVWGKVLVPKGQVDDSRWLKASVAKRAARAVSRLFMRVGMRIWHGFEVRGVEHLPHGPFIVAANHASHLDTGAVVTAFGSRGSELFIMGARDYFFSSRPRGWFFHTFLNVVPFDRTENMIKGLRLAQSVLRSGRPVLIFPEGTRGSDGDLHPFKPGIGLLGVELGVPIVPCLIEGTFRALPKGKLFPRRAPIRVTFGPAIAMDNYRAQHAQYERRELYRKVACDVRELVAQLKQESQA